jgi:hypothetical protein
MNVDECRSARLSVVTSSPLAGSNLNATRLWRTILATATMLANIDANHVDGEPVAQAQTARRCRRIEPLPHDGEGGHTNARKTSAPLGVRCQEPNYYMPKVFKGKRRIPEHDSVPSILKLDTTE